MSETKTKLQTVSDEELEQELKRRKEKAQPPPSPLPNPDFSTLMHTVVEGLTMAIDNQYEDEDFRQWVYEAAMEAVYGENFWEWRNKQKW